MPYGYGSANRGSTNQGPAGGASAGGNYGGNRNPQQRSTPAPEPAPTRSRQESVAREEKAKAIASKAARTQVYKDPDPVTETVSGDLTFEPVVKQLLNIGPSLHGDMKEPEETLQEMIARQQEEKYGPLADPTKLGETIDKRTQKEKDEDWERGQDWDLIKDMSKKGYGFDEIQKAAEKGLTVKAPTSDRRQNLIDFGLRSIMPETGLERSLLNRMKSFAPRAKTGLSSLTDKMGSLGQYFNPQKMIMNFALNKMGLGFINPLLGLASLFGFKNPFKNMGTSYAGVPYKKGPTIESRDGPSKSKDIVTESIQKFRPTDQQTAQMTEIMRKRLILQGYADKGALNERGQNTLAQMNQLINQYQVSPESIFKV